MISRQVRDHISKKLTVNEVSQNDETNSNVRYFKLPYIGSYSSLARNKIRKLIEKFCKPIEVKIVFTICKISSICSVLKI